VPETILVVDDDPSICRMLERTLVAEGYGVEAVADGGTALASIERSVPDLVILDLGLPGVDGVEVCRRVRARGLATPILMLTARDALADRVAGLDAGGDDYVVKPFESDELSARIRALLRRGRERTDVLAYEDLVFDVSLRRLRRGDREIALSEREAALLELFLRNPRRVVTREAALAHVWGSPYAATANSVDRYVSYLRRKLGDPPLIETVRGVGFILGG
jgi:two-component system response regulator MprA